jgi:hypothetical protein
MLHLVWETNGGGERKEKHEGLELVAHTCNPSYSGGRDQEDRGSKPARGKSLLDPILKKPFTKKGR